MFGLSEIVSWCFTCFTVGFSAGFAFGKYLNKRPEPKETEQVMKCHHPLAESVAKHFDPQHRFIKFKAYLIKNRVVRIHCEYMHADQSCMKDSQKCRYLP